MLIFIGCSDGSNNPVSPEPAGKLTKSNAVASTAEATLDVLVKYDGRRVPGLHVTVSRDSVQWTNTTNSRGVARVIIVSVNWQTHRINGRYQVVVRNPLNDILYEDFVYLKAGSNSHIVSFTNHLSEYPLRLSPGLETTIRDEYDITDDIYFEDVVFIDDLKVHEGTASSLAGMEYLVNLKSLEIDRNLITDLTPLARLRYLDDISIRYNPISDISALSQLTNLRRLKLYGNQINDISALASLTNIRNLELGGNNISNISPLAGMDSLNHYIGLNHNQISDISPLAHLGEFTGIINLAYNQISDLSPLVSLELVSELWLIHNTITDITPLQYLTSLRHVSLKFTQVTDISALVNNPGIGSGDYIDLPAETLNEKAILVQVPALESRGVNVQVITWIK
jgi:hypothetical protein